MLTVIADNIDLTGKVSFNSFDNTVITEIEDLTTYTVNNTTIYGNQIATGTITASHIKSSSIQAHHIDGYAITADQIAANTITSAEIASGAINTAELAAGAVTADKIKAGAITVDKISSNNSNRPVITLFDHCEIDASYLNGEGKGTAIRLKWDDYNYVYQGENIFALFQSSNGEAKILSISADGNGTKIYNKDNYVLALDSSLIYRGSTVLTAGNYTSYCAKASHGTHVTFGGNGSASTCSRSDHSHSGYASSSHSHSGYASSSHTHDIISYGSSYVDCYSSSITIKTSDLYLTGGNINSNSIQPNSTNSYNLGWSSYKWNQVSAKNVYADYCSGSDASIKENIRYIKPTNASVFSGNAEPEEILNPNSDNDINLGVSGTDLYDFVKNDLKLCEYNYNDDYVRNGKTGDVTKTNFDNKIGFIAQDLQDSYVGQLIVGEWEGQLSYNLNNYVSVLGGALQYDIMFRDEQIAILENTIADLEARINALENKQ
jgi:hypothetical protein